MVFAGYVNAPGATLERLRDGWFRTGDIGSIDADGLLRITDRRDDLFISGGENVYPAQVEAVLLDHPAVADVVVFAQSEARWGSVPVAAVVLLDDAATADGELDRHCRERLAAYKVPQRYIRVVELPRDSLGKIRRRELAARLGAAR
jgi:acyl-CoA synthetase (AMP-forming)/AMP-acid ligase II